MKRKQSSINLRRVYLLWHSREFEDGTESDILVGVYTTKRKAEKAIQRKLQFPGFRDFPDDFLIDLGLTQLDFVQKSDPIKSTVSRRKTPLSVCGEGLGWGQLRKSYDRYLLDLDAWSEGFINTEDMDIE